MRWSPSTPSCTGPALLATPTGECSRIALGFRPSCMTEASWPGTQVAWPPEGQHAPPPHTARDAGHIGCPPSRPGCGVCSLQGQRRDQGSGKPRFHVSSTVANGQWLKAQGQALNTAQPLSSGIPGTAWTHTGRATCGLGPMSMPLRSLSGVTTPRGQKLAPVRPQPTNAVGWASMAKESYAG